MKIPFTWIAIAILMVALLALWLRYDYVSGDRDRLSKNQESLLTEQKDFKFRDSLQVSQIGSLELTKNEFKRHFEEAAKEAKDLGIKIKRIESYTSITTQVKDSFKTVFKDSITIKHNTIKCFKYNDKWLSFDGCAINDTLNVGYSLIDSVEIFAHRVPRKFLFIKYGTRGVNLTTFSKNPNSKIINKSFIEIK